MARLALVRRAPPYLRRLSFACLAFVFAAGAVIPAVAAEPALESFEIVTATGAHVFQVELANTPESRARGLMYRRAMAEDHGMLFDFGIESTVGMWMKNTCIPLDMIFISRNGVVVSVAMDAEPFSERVISSGKPAYAVIELNAGTARRIGVMAGDLAHHPIFRH